MKSIDELAANLTFTTAKTGEDRSVTFLPDPPKAPRRYTLISVDDHIVEPPDTFTGRLPQRYADRAPKVVDTADGGQTWVYDDQELPNVGFNAVVAGMPVTISRIRTPRANTDSSMSASAMRWSMIVPASRITAARQARR